MLPTQTVRQNVMKKKTVGSLYIWLVYELQKFWASSPILKKSESALGENLVFVEFKNRTTTSFLWGVNYYKFGE